MSALSKNPSFKLATDLTGLRQQRSGLNPRDPNYATQRTQINNAIIAAKKTSSSGAAQNPNSYDSITNQAFGAMNPLLNQIQNQGAFNPGSFKDTQDAAYNHAMDSFNTQMNPVYAKQEADFQQMAAERGWDPTSQDFARAHQLNVEAPQNQARQQAMDSAYQQGLGAQQQAFAQSYQQYMAPEQNLQYLDPFYRYNTSIQAQQQQNAWQTQQAATNQQYALELQKHAGGGTKVVGGGGLSLQDQMALQNNNFYNQMALMGMQGGQQQQPSIGNGIASGLASGIGAGIASGLAR